MNRTRLMPTSAATVALNHDAATTTPLLVRGNNRAQGDFFGNVISALHVPLRTAWGTMEGTYQMERADKRRFRAQIGRFFLVPPAPKPSTTKRGLA